MTFFKFKDIPDAPNVACSPFYELESKDANSEEERNTEKRSLWSLEHGFEGWFSSENEDAFVDTDDSHRDWHADSSGENKSRPIILENVAALKKKSSKVLSKMGNLWGEIRLLLFIYLI